MTVSDSNKIEEEFIEAKSNWELEKLYVDLGSAKGKSLTPVEKKFLRGLLCGFSPAEIANTVYHSRSSSTVRVYLSNGLYKYIEEMLSNKAGYSVKVKNWSRVTNLLEKAGYKKAWMKIELISNQIKTNIRQETDVIKSNRIEDWGEAIDVGIFYGRTKELAQIKEWIGDEQCRLVVLLGMGGVGKTALSVKLAEEIKNKFEYVIWRSLRLAPSIDVILTAIWQILSPPERKTAENVESSISELIDCLRSSRCLIVLDSFDSILSSKYADSASINSTISRSKSIKDFPTHLLSQIEYRQGYEEYGELIRRVGDSHHQSCLLLTSREKPQEIAALEGEKLPVRCLKLNGLSYGESREILQTKGLANFREEESKLLIDWYAGNPLFIKLVTTAIQELFGGSIYEFLEQGTIVFGDIRGILDQQFSRLSDLEKLVMYWLALNQNVVSLRKLQKDIVPRVSQRLILEAVELLQRRSLIERQASSFSQIPVLRSYIAERLIEENFKLIEEKRGSLLMSYTFFEAQLKNYIRDMHTSADI